MKDSERQDFLRVRPPQARIPSKRTKMDTQDEIARRNRLRSSWSVRISLGQIVYYHKIPHVEQGRRQWYFCPTGTVIHMFDSTIVQYQYLG